ncbi:ATP synthase F1 subunit delta [Levilactobacillus suantsaii]|uniref:ATP synthase subunit delta n=1 Tax=Levilactobacillus suantsaii TaxID=2292255 RepID=A0A4Q0VL96_9LACO|nr:ATP synthase F1 subunit delta [Levilactobacillus suantsaii]QMU07949.1 F0F1 ATP synthase subunit delta [Levilactobacillus suantsaii]RXI79829.1 F0F1 ATP synthase subunit delta [Levilactobacillus suantsaii]
MSLDRTTVAKRYARALFELLSEKDQLEDGYAELQELRRVFQDNPQLGTVLSDASLQAADREKLVDQLAEQASPYIQNLIHMVYDYGRMDAMVAIVNQFQSLYDEKHHIVYAHVTTAIDLSAEQKDQISTAYAQRVGAQKVILNSQVDPTILGGVIVESAGMILDGSLKTKINKLRRRLLA